MPRFLASIPTPVRRTIGIGVVLFVVAYLLVPQLAGARNAAEVAASVQPLLLVAAISLYAVSIIAQAMLVHAVLPGHHRPTGTAVLRIELAATAVSHTVPGGTAAGSALGYRLLRHAGVTGAEAGFAIGVRGVGSAVVLNVILWAALVVSIPLHGFSRLYTLAALLGAALLGLVGAVVILLVRNEEATSRTLRRVLRRVPGIDDAVVTRTVARVAEQLRDLGRQRDVAGRVIGWAAVHWLANAASLWVFLAAFGHQARVDDLLVAFGLVNVLAVVPITPRGMGVVEAVLIPTLVGFGAPRGQAIVGVLAWRLVSFWLPIPVGAASYVSLRAVPAAAAEDRRPLRDRLGDAATDLAETAKDEAEDVRSWARRIGLRRGDGDA